MEYIYYALKVRAEINKTEICQRWPNHSVIFLKGCDCCVRGFVDVDFVVFELYIQRSEAFR